MCDSFKKQVFASLWGFCLSGSLFAASESRDASSYAEGDHGGLHSGMSEVGVKPPSAVDDIEQDPEDSTDYDSEVDILDRIHAATVPQKVDEASREQGVVVEGDVVWRTLSNIEKADFYFSNENYLLAERFYVRALEKSRDADEQKKALVQLAEVYFAREKPIKAINILEEALDKYPLLQSDPEFVYRLAEIYRAGEMRQEAIALFYKVINTIVVGNAHNLDEFIDLARLAKFQIARLLYEDGEFEQAFGAFNRIELLEMSDENHEIVMYYKVLASLKAAKPDVGRELIEAFLERFPFSEYSPELMYLRAEVLFGMGKVEEGSRQLLDLLDYVEGDEIFSSEWVFWRQQAGNRLANRYYAEGDYLMALRIYQGVVSLNEAPSWRLPIIYQMSLCFEKLNMYDRAKESYTFLLEDLALITPEKMSPVLKQLKSSAEWRLKVLSWKEDTEADAASLLNQPVES